MTRKPNTQNGASLICLSGQPALKVCLAASSSDGFHAQHTQAAPHAALGRHVKDEDVKDTAQDVAEEWRRTCHST